MASSPRPCRSLIPLVRRNPAKKNTVERLVVKGKFGLSLKFFIIRFHDFVAVIPRSLRCILPTVLQPYTTLEVEALYTIVDRFARDRQPNLSNNQVIADPRSDELA